MEPKTQIRVTVREDGSPFPSEMEALDFIRDKKMRDVRPYMYRGGWGIAKEGLTEEEIDPLRKQREEDEAKSARAAKAAAELQKFYRVVIHAPTNPLANGEQTHVLLTDGNYYLTVMRGQQVVLPDSLVQVLKHACHDVAQYVPGYGRQVMAPDVPRFPYNVIGQATREDFLQFLREGNVQQNQQIKVMEAQTLSGAARPQT